eukprot:m.36585 g.36585  ORF g.36585 m.36585 type:complete len:259 (+) comp9150_c0_seq2:27-803(+)
MATITPETISSLRHALKEKYPELMEYFVNDKSLRKLMDMSEEDALKIVDRPDRIDMLEFFRADVKPRAIQKSHYTHEKVLDFHGKVVSKALEGIYRETATLESKLDKLDPRDLENVEVIDISGNELQIDDDLNCLYEIKKKIPQLKVVRLEYNRLRADGATEEKLLRVMRSNPDVVFSIYGTPLASVEAKEKLFNVIARSLLHRLIFVPQGWLKAKHWTNLIASRSDSNPDLEEAVQQAHLQFFRSYGEQECTEGYNS